MMPLKKLLVVADSISIDYGPYLRRALLGIYEYDRKRGSGDQVENLDEPIGENGGDSAQVLEFLSRLAAQHSRWDVLLINCGLHDIRRRGKAARLQIAGRIVWVRTTPVDDKRHNSLATDFQRFQSDVNRYNDIADELAAKHRIPTIDFHALTANLGNASIATTCISRTR